MKHVPTKGLIKGMTLGLLTGLAALPFGAVAQTVQKPDKIMVCAACHGENGVATQPMYPNLAGQYENYLQQALFAYRKEERKNPIMDAQAHDLTDAEIIQLATWFSQQKPAVYTPEANPEAK